MNDENCYGNVRNVGPSPSLSASSKVSNPAPYVHHCPISQRLSPILLSQGPTKGRAGSSFNSLLKDASNKVRVDYDEKVAVDLTVNEALNLMDDWARENKDNQIAKEIAVRDEREEAARKSDLKSAVAMGEAAALKVAIDETRRIKAEAKARETRSQTDSDLAKSIYEADEKEQFESSKVVMMRSHEDEKLARQMSDGSMSMCMADDKECKDADADDKDTYCDAGDCDEKSSYKEEVEEKERREEKEEKEEKEDEDTEAIVRMASEKFQQLDADEAVAQAAQRQFQNDIADEYEASKRDFQLSRRMAVKVRV
jgi:hypothetical protein